jgi:1-acyl-sn-glycerol-3-phosphate acyltransferase
VKRWDLQPANDFGKPLYERLKSLHRENGFLGVLARAIWWLIVRLYLRLFHRLAIVGREHLPKSTPFVMVANHSSHLDALTLAASLPFSLCDRAFALAAGDTFFTSMPASAFAAIAMNALPIWRSQTRRDHLSVLRERLIEGKCVYLLFPEGTRSRNGTMTNFKPGLGAVIAGTDIPVVPCYIAGAHMAFPPNRRFPRPVKVTLSIGTPISFPSIVNRMEGWREIALTLEASVRHLSGQSGVVE